MPGLQPALLDARVFLSGSAFGSAGDEKDFQGLGSFVRFHGSLLFDHALGSVRTAKANIGFLLCGNFKRVRHDGSLLSGSFRSAKKTFACHAEWH